MPHQYIYIYTMSSIIEENEPIKIAILMPIYNGTEFLEEAFSSILLQTYKHWQLWIGVNGHPKGSPVYDRIKNIIEPFAKEHDIMLLDFGLPANKSATLNKMVRILSPDIEYVALLDVDDIWFPTKLAHQIPLLQKGYQVVGTKCVYFGPNILPNIVPPIPIGDFSTGYDFKSSNPLINSSIIIHTSFAKWNDDDENILEDYELWLNLHKMGGVKFYNCPEVLVKHRIHPHSAFNNRNGEHVGKLLMRF